jgi:hypothetical protein
MMETSVAADVTDRAWDGNVGDWNGGVELQACAVRRAMTPATSDWTAGADQAGLLHYAEYSFRLRMSANSAHSPELCQRGAAAALAWMAV